MLAPVTVFATLHTYIYLSLGSLPLHIVSENTFRSFSVFVRKNILSKYVRRERNRGKVMLALVQQII